MNPRCPGCLTPPTPCSHSAAVACPTLNPSSPHSLIPWVGGGLLHCTLRARYMRRSCRKGSALYPVMLDVAGKSCLVVGGGGVALRKVQGLAEEGARVTVVAPDAVEPLREMAASGLIEWWPRAYRTGDAASATLVFAATDNPDVNDRVFEDASDAGIWVNVADVPDNCSFHLPARVRRGPLQLAVGSAGEAPFAVAR